MEYLTPFRKELITLAGTVWPAVKPNGVYRTRDILKKDFAKKINAAQLPLLVLDLDPRPWEEGPLTVRADLVTTSIYLVVGDDVTGDELVQELEAMRSALYPDDRSEPLETGQVMQYPRISDSIELPVNSFFLRQGWTCYAGVVMTSILTGENP